MNLADKPIAKKGAWSAGLGLALFVQPLVGMDHAVPSPVSYSLTPETQVERLPSGAWASASSPSSAGSRLTSPAPYGQDALESAYREDFVDMEHPFFLGLKEADALAELLGVCLDIYQVNAQAPLLEGRQGLNCHHVSGEDFRDDCSSHSVLFNGRHFSVLTYPRRAEKATYYDQVAPEEIGWREGGPVKARRVVPVAPDGHCLITTAYFIKKERFPKPGKIEMFRNVLCAQMTSEEVAKEVQELKQEIMANPEQYPWDAEAACFATLGPRLSAAFRQDPAFAAALSGAEQRQRDLLAALHSSHGPALDEAMEEKQLSNLPSLQDEVEVATVPEDDEEMAEGDLSRLCHP